MFVRWCIGQYHSHFISLFEYSLLKVSGFMLLHINHWILVHLVYSLLIVLLLLIMLRSLLVQLYLVELGSQVRCGSWGVLRLFWGLLAHVVALCLELVGEHHAFKLSRLLKLLLLMHLRRHPRWHLLVWKHRHPLPIDVRLLLHRLLHVLVELVWLQVNTFLLQMLKNML